MPLEKGTLIFANYTSKVKDTQEGIDSTREEDAKKFNMYDPTRKYAPRLIAVGDGWVINGLDEEVKKMEVGERKEVVLSPERAFGARDPTQTRMVPLRKFGEREHEIRVGDSVDLDNRIGVVRFIGSGRAQVDFNHRLAGKSIVYDFEVVRKVEGDEEKARALVQRRFGDEGEKLSLLLKDDKLTIGVPEELFLMDGLQIVKRGVSTDIFKYLPWLKDLTFEEDFANKNQVPKEVKAEKAEPKAEEVKNKPETPQKPPTARRKKAPASPAP